VNSGSATVPPNILAAVYAPIRNDGNFHRHFYVSARPLSIGNRDSNGACAHQVHSHRISSQLAGPSWWRCERRLRQRQVGKTGGGNRTGGRAQKVTVHARPAENNHSSGMRSRAHILAGLGWFGGFGSGQLLNCSQSAAIHLPRASVRMRPTLRVLAGSASVPQRCRGDQQVVDQRTAQCNHEWHISSRAAQHRRTLHETGRWLALTMARTSSDTLPKRRLKVDRRLPRGLTHLSGSSSRYAPKRSSAAGQCEKLVPLGDR
jgi:hypothetical protein